MSGWSVNLTTLFLGSLRPPKRLTSTSCTHFRQKLTTALLEKAEGETKVLPDRVSNPGLLIYESGALPIALCARLVPTILSLEHISMVPKVFKPLNFNYIGYVLPCYPRSSHGEV